MKYIKPLGIIFVISIMMAVNGVNAAKVISVSGTLPAFSGTKNVGNASKTDYSNQEIKQTTSVDLLSENDRETKVRLVVSSLPTEWKVSRTGRAVTFGEDTIATTPASFDLQVKASKSTISKVSWRGTWAYETK